MASYEDKIVILIEAVDKTNKALSDIQKNLGKVKTETMSFGKLLGGITLGSQLSNSISGITNHLKSAAAATLKWAGDMETFALSISSSLLVGGQYADSMTGKAGDSAKAFGLARQ